MKKNKSFFYKKAIFLLVILIPFFFSLTDILKGSIPFWYDPARDFLLAQANLQKIRLIGPETGIPGIFYGPFWIWLLSFGQLISKDPRVIALLVQTIPYFTLFPLILYKLTKEYGKLTFITLWLLFILNFKNYTTFLWNPHLAPLLFLVLIYFLSSLRFPAKNKKGLLYFIIVGITSGLILNIHMSFGTGIIFATFMYLAILSVWHLLKNKKKLAKTFRKSFISIFMVVVGLLFTALPFFVFEIRHGFQQIKAVQNTIFKTVINSSDVVGQSGIEPEDIPMIFLQQINELLKIPNEYSRLILFLSFGVLLIELKRKKEKLNEKEIKILLFILLSSISILSFYLSSTNPVWIYHFIAVEIIFLLWLLILIAKSKIARYILATWAIIMLISNTKTFVLALDFDPLQIQSLTSKKSIVNLIYNDSGNQPFTVFAFSPAIYTYDFDYLFIWLSQENNLALPIKELKENVPVYLIIPETDKDTELDFINYKTPNVEFETSKKWKTPDNTLILKRKRKTF